MRFTQPIIQRTSSALVFALLLASACSNGTPSNGQMPFGISKSSNTRATSAEGSDQGSAGEVPLAIDEVVDPAISTYKIVAQNVAAYESGIARQQALLAQASTAAERTAIQNEIARLTKELAKHRVWLAEATIELQRHLSRVPGARAIAARYLGGLARIVLVGGVIEVIFAGQMAHAAGTRGLGGVLNSAAKDAQTNGWDAKPGSCYSSDGGNAKGNLDKIRTAASRGLQDGLNECANQFEVAQSIGGAGPAPGYEDVNKCKEDCKRFVQSLAGTPVRSAQRSTAR